MERVGVLAGLGPAAGADFYIRLIRATPAERDQDHLPIVMWADPTVPDRTLAYEGTGEPVVGHIEAGLKALDAVGAHFIVSPCNTIHIWLADTADRLGVELLSIISVTTKAAMAETVAGASIGVLGTNPTLDSGLYSSALAEYGRRAVVPDGQSQEKITEAIYLVKIGRPNDLCRASQLVSEVAQHLVAQGATAIISGCTEVSVALSDIDLVVPLVDSMDALVNATLKRWRTGNKKQSTTKEQILS